MRLALLISTLLVLLSPCAEGSSPIVPTILLTISPSNANVNASTEKDMQVEFQGTVTVDKLPVVRAVATIQSSVDTGWVAALSPSTFVFTSAGSEQFTCTVVVPKNTNSTTGTLTIVGKVVANGFQSQPTQVTAFINVNGTGLLNITAHNRTGASASTRTGGADYMTLSMISVGASVAAVSGFVAFRVVKKRKAFQETSSK
jgi:hypothetical protein